MNKKLINEWGAAMPKSNPYKEPKRPSKPLTTKKPNNPWAKSEEPEEDIPVGKREKRFDPNNWKNESRNMNKKLIRLTESDLHRIVKESVQRILAENGENEGLFDFFKKKKQPVQQKPLGSNLPDGVYKDLKTAAYGSASNSRVKVYVIQTNIGNLYVGGSDMRKINEILKQLRQNGIRVSNYDEKVVDNPNYNGLRYRDDGHTGEREHFQPKVGYGDTRYGYGNGQDFDALLR